MHDSLIDLLDRVDLAVSESRGVISSDVLDRIARVALSARGRLSYPESILVVALAGGTGSGKSSLFNALAGEDLALTGGIRPMTVDPLALVPAKAQGSLNGLLDSLGVLNRVETDATPWLCLIDLPDNDSVELSHRRQVDDLLPRVDVVVWVTDPEKYRDASLHAGHIAPLAAYQRQFIFVLNQVDRLDESDAASVLDDFSEALREDGIAEPVVIATAAHPDSGPPIGIDLVAQRLEAARDRRGTVHEKVLIDLEAATATLVRASSGGGGTDFESRWRRQLEESARLVSDDRVADAAHGVNRFVARLGEEVGDETSAGLRSIAEGSPGLFLSCVMESSGPPAQSAPGIWRWRQGHGADPSPAAEPDLEGLISRVDRAVGEPVREIVARRARAHAAVNELALAVGEFRRRAPIGAGRHSTDPERS